MIQQVDFKEYEDEIFRMSTIQDFMRLFNDEIISMGDILKVRRWIRQSDKEMQKFRKKMDAAVTGLIQDKQLISERHGIGWWILGDMDAARKALKQAKTARAHAFIAKSLEDEGQTAEALDYLEGLSAKELEHVDVIVRKIHLLFSAKDLEPTLDLAAKLAKDYPEDIESIKGQALVASESGEPQKAIDMYRQVLDADPVDEEALFYLGGLLDRFGEDEEALNCYEKAADIFPVRVNTVLNLGQMYYEMGETEKAAFCFKRVLKLRPAHVIARRFMEDVSATENMYYDEQKAKKQEELNRILQIPVTDFELSVRSRNCLSRMNIRSLGDLIQKTEADLLSYKNFGETSLAEIKKMLASKALYLGQAKDMQNQELKEKQKRKIIDVTDSELLMKPITDLELSVRASKCLLKMGINTFGDLIKYDEGSMLRMRNFGQTSLNEIKQKLSAYGLSLANE